MEVDRREKLVEQSTNAILNPSARSENTLFVNCPVVQYLHFHLVNILYFKDIMNEELQGSMASEAVALLSSSADQPDFDQRSRDLRRQSRDLIRGSRDNLSGSKDNLRGSKDNVSSRINIKGSKDNLRGSKDNLRRPSLDLLGASNSVRSRSNDCLNSKHRKDSNEYFVF